MQSGGSAAPYALSPPGSTHTLATVSINMYKSAADLYVGDYDLYVGDCTFIARRHNPGSPNFNATLYALASVPLIRRLPNSAAVLQSWYADDASSPGQNAYNCITMLRLVYGHSMVTLSTFLKHGLSLSKPTRTKQKQFSETPTSTFQQKEAHTWEHPYIGSSNLCSNLSPTKLRNGVANSNTCLKLQLPSHMLPMQPSFMA